jgi:DNA-binding transcriptional LysR family regulator
VILRPSHPLAKQASVRLKELEGYPLCLPESSLRTRQLLKEAEIAERVSLQPSITSNSLLLLRNLLCSSDLVTLMPMLAVVEEIERGELVARPLISSLLPETLGARNLPPRTAFDAGTLAVDGEVDCVPERV